MKRLFIAAAVTVLLSGCSAVDNSRVYTLNSLSFRTELEVTENVDSIHVKDEAYDGVFSIFCERSSENIPSFEEYYQGLIDQYMSMDKLADGWTADYCMDEKTVMIDGTPTQAKSLEISLYRPEVGCSRYYVEEVRLELGEELYGIRYVYDTMLDDVEYNYDPEHDNDDIQEVKDRAALMYENIQINSGAAA